VAGNVELPAVVDAAEPWIEVFVAAEKQAGAAVRTLVGDQPHPAPRIAKGDQAFAQQQHADGVAAGLRHFGRQQRRQPVLAKQRPHRRSGADLCQQSVVCLAEHRARPGYASHLAA
jgi:hypothetical protein